MALGPDHAQVVELRRGQTREIQGIKIRKTFWFGRLVVTSPPTDFIRKKEKHTVAKGASYGMTYFEEEKIDGQSVQVAHTITFV